MEGIGRPQLPSTYARGRELLFWPLTNSWWFSILSNEFLADTYRIPSAQRLLRPR